MSLAKGVAIGFVAGLAAAGGVFLLLRDDTSREAARLAELDAHIRQLDQSVSTLSGRMTMQPPSIGVPAASAPTVAMPPAPTSAKSDAKQADEIAEADALVDLGLQSGHWTRQQHDELDVALAGLPVKEQGRIKSRLALAINAGEVQMDMRR
jgi:hypothetical protein